MTKEQYDNDLKVLFSEYERAKIELAKKFALENNSIKEGDIVTDHVGSIKVEKIQVTLGSFDDPPSCVYFGIELKKDLTPTKKATKRDVYQSNLITQ